MFGKHNRFAWFEEEKKPVSDKKLMIIEYVITDLQLIQDSFPPELRKGPIVVYFKLMDLPPVKFTQEFLKEMMVQQQCDFFRTGKSCILALSELPEFPPTLIDLEVRIFRLISECACVHEYPIAMSKVDLNPVFREITNEYKMTPCKVPIIKTQRDWYLLTTDESGSKKAGTIDIDIRLSCFDKLAVSQMTIGTQEAVLTIENKVPTSPQLCVDCSENTINLCSTHDSFHDGDISRFLLDGMMAIATSGIPDDIDNWIALAKHQGWKPRPRPIVEKQQGEAIISKICPDECEGFKPRYPRPRYSQIRKDSMIPPECTDVCPTYEDAFKQLPTCPKKRKRIEDFLKGRKPCHNLCSDCYLEHEPPILPANIHVPAFSEYLGEDEGEDFWHPFPFGQYPFPFEKEEESPPDNPEDCDPSCPWYAPEAIAKRKRKSFKYFKDGLRFEKPKKCPEQCPDCFYDDSEEKHESSITSSSTSSARSSTSSTSSSVTNSNSGSTSGSSSNNDSKANRKKKKKYSPPSKKLQPKEDCKCIIPNDRQRIISVYMKYLPGANKQDPKEENEKSKPTKQTSNRNPEQQRRNKGQPSQSGDGRRVAPKNDRGDSQKHGNNRNGRGKENQNGDNENQGDNRGPSQQQNKKPKHGKNRNAPQQDTDSLSNPSEDEGKGNKNKKNKKDKDDKRSTPQEKNKKPKHGKNRKSSEDSDRLSNPSDDEGKGNKNKKKKKDKGDKRSTPQEQNKKPKHDKKPDSSSDSETLSDTSEDEGEGNDKKRKFSLERDKLVPRLLQNEVEGSAYQEYLNQQLSE